MLAFSPAAPPPRSDEAVNPMRRVSPHAPVFCFTCDPGEILNYFEEQQMAWMAREQEQEMRKGS